MSDIDEAEIIVELVRATGEAAALEYPEWTHAVSARVYPSSGVGTWEVVAYQNSDGKRVELFDHDEIDERVSSSSRRLFEAQGAEWAGMKCSVARSGKFTIEYSYDIDEAIKWAGDGFEGGSTPGELIAALRPVGL